MICAYRCGCFPCVGMNDGATVVSDNCCQCNYAALRRMVEIGEVEVIYATYHVDVGETPFFVAVDFTRRKIVISIRGTLSMKVGIRHALLNCICTIFVLFLNFLVWCNHNGMNTFYDNDFIIVSKITDTVIFLPLRSIKSVPNRDFFLVLSS